MDRRLRIDDGADQHNVVVYHDPEDAGKAFQAAWDRARADNHPCPYVTFVSPSGKTVRIFLSPEDLPE